MNETIQPQLELIEGGRDVLDRLVLKLVIKGGHKDIGTTIEALKPRGKLTLVEPRDPPLPVQRTRG
ncbi:MAG TPA: hypothetical protein VN039_13445 [Nitrospira sp.]|nr:hypothetical protein [Nitrospira sp.]